LKPALFSIAIAVLVLCWTQPAAADDFYDYVASHCLIDALARSPYAIGWETWIKEEKRSRKFVPEHSPTPIRRAYGIPAPGSEKAVQRAEMLRTQWRAEPRSHVVDCRVDFEPGDPKNPKATRTWYTAYLPRALIVDPSKVRSILLLVPGGNGGRTRYFLTPIPRKTIYNKMSGGLQTKYFTDEWLKANPGASAPIIAATNGPALLHTNGPVAFFTRDLPTHLATTYLGRPHTEVALGVEGISSGSRELMHAFRAQPEAFNTLGLTCMHCRRNDGIDPDKHLGTDVERWAWLTTVGQRARDGRLHIRFSVGNRDNQWGCNKEFHDLFVQAGALAKTAPRYDECKEDKEVGTDWCDTHWDGFYLVEGAAHHYGLLIDSWRPQLEWHLERLDKVVGKVYTQ
jgi:hypothetical protein